MASAAISAGTSILSGIMGGKGASKAAKVQAAAYQSGIDEQRSEFAQTQANFAPFLSGGTAAEEEMRRILGLGDSNTGVAVGTSPAYSADQQQAGAISHLKDGPLFQALYGTGADTILQNASATGGLRGGNTQNSLAQFGSNTLASVIQSQLANLSGLAGMGSGAAGSLGSLGAQNASAISGLLSQQGAARATGAAAPYAAAQGTLNQLGAIKW